VHELISTSPLDYSTDSHSNEQGVVCAGILFNEVC